MLDNHFADICSRYVGINLLLAKLKELVTGFNELLISRTGPLNLFTEGPHYIWNVGLKLLQSFIELFNFRLFKADKGSNDSVKVGVIFHVNPHDFTAILVEDCFRAIFKENICEWIAFPYLLDNFIVDIVAFVLGLPVSVIK